MQILDAKPANKAARFVGSQNQLAFSEATFRTSAFGTESVESICIGGSGVRSSGRRSRPAFSKDEDDDHDHESDNIAPRANQLEQSGRHCC